MSTKQLLLDSMLKEIAVVKHLHSKVPAGGENYRPTFNQRTVLELLRYLSYTGLSGANYSVTGNFDSSKPLREAAEKLTLADIPAALDRQAAALKDLFAKLNETELAGKEITMPWGAKNFALNWLVELPLKWLTGYRMQLFLYLKQAGRTELATSNCWRGEDPKPK